MVARVDGEVVFIDRPINLRLEKDIIFAEVHSGARTIVFAAKVQDFLESFARAAQVAHKWTEDNATAAVIPLAKHSSRRAR